MTERTDEELLAAHANGDPYAFTRLVDRYLTDLLGFVTRYVGNTAAAEDLIQDTFIQVHASIDSFDPSRNFRPWLYTIAANKARDFLRSRGRRRMYSLDQTGDNATSTAELVEEQSEPLPEFTDNEETRAAVREVVDRMPDNLRLVLILGYYQQLPYAQIADILEIPVGTVKSRLHSAVQHFGRLWRQFLRTEATPPS